ncbi:MAG: primosomal protein N' (replication factor Y) - superfamily II helicase [Cyanobacteria bacterium J06632_22]
MAFEPSKGLLACGYCEHSQAMPDVDAERHDQVLQEHDFHAFANADQTQIAALTSTAQEVDCPGCRATLTFEPPDVADCCPFCGTSIVAQAHATDPSIVPTGVIPFKVGRKQANEALRDWLSVRWNLRDFEALFLPGKLKDLAQQQGLSGVYLPFWTFDAHTVNDYRGEQGTHHYEYERDSDGDLERVQKTSWKPASGQMTIPFNDVLVAASEVMDAEKLRRLWPRIWAGDLEPYSPAYLAGFKAQRYQVPLQQGFEIAQKRMDASIRGLIKRDIGGDDQKIHKISTVYSQETFRYILLPVWLMSYRYQGETYQVMVNAQTGKVFGERPWSPWKTLVVLAIALAAFAAVVKFLVG